MYRPLGAWTWNSKKFALGVERSCHPTLRLGREFAGRVFRAISMADVPKDRKKSPTKERAANSTPPKENIL